MAVPDKIYHGKLVFRGFFTDSQPLTSICKISVQALFGNRIILPFALAIKCMVWYCCAGNF
jgi:hypothetical protein